MRLRVAVFLSLFSVAPIAMALDRSLQPGEGQYQQAVALLKQSDPQLFEMMRAIAAKQVPANLSAIQVHLATQYQLAQQLLSAAAEAGHPVAQYRLALLYQTYMTPDKDQEICQLSASSLEAGFAPAALYLANACLSYTQSALYVPALQGALAHLSDYAFYYPQPVVWLTCGAPPNGVELQLASENDVRAELYKLLASQADRNTAMALRIDYLKKAVATNGCPSAQVRLERYAAPQ